MDGDDVRVSDWPRTLPCRRYSRGNGEECNCAFCRRPYREMNRRRLPLTCQNVVVCM